MELIDRILDDDNTVRADGSVESVSKGEKTLTVRGKNNLPKTSAGVLYL